MFWFVLIILIAMCAIPTYGTIQLFKDKDYKVAAVGVFGSLLLIFISSLILGQVKEDEAFSKKCHDANGMVVRGECIDQSAVIEIKR